MEILVPLPGHPRCALGDDFLRRGWFLGVGDVARAAATRAVFVRGGGGFARVAFADDVAVDVGGGVGTDVAGAC